MAGTTTINLFGDWKTAVKLIAQAGPRFTPAANLALKREAVRAQNLMRKNIGKGKPQAETTRATGGGGKPLRRAGDLRGAINVVQVGSLNAFIGVPRTEDKFNIAVVHEEGRVIVQPLTERMRQFLIIKLRKLGPPLSGGSGSAKRVLVTKIPARPFIGPAIAQVHQGFQQRFADTFSRALKGEYGRL